MAINLTSGGSGGGGSSVTPTFSESASFTFSLAQAGAIGTLTPSSAMTATIPTNASVAFPIGTIIGLSNYSAQTVTITPASGVTLLPTGSGTSGSVTMAAYTSRTIRQIATDVWMAS